VSANLERPPDEGALTASSGGFDISVTEATELSLVSLPLGAHLILRCRKDWRTATVTAITLDQITLSVASPTGHTYRVRRPPDAALSFDGSIPILGEGCWRAGLARYDRRW
jgi:hypothetical protein